MGRTTAGGSAAAKAAELRAKAAKLEEQARAWDKGSEGERRTAAVLSSLSSRGYVVLDDLSIPGSKANIDHVVIGPTGVTVVETKAYTGRLNLRDGVLWHGRYPLRREHAAAQFEADKVREVVASTGWEVAVRSIMCIHGADVPTDPDRALGLMELCSPLNLLDQIDRAPRRLEPMHIAHLAGLISAALPPQNIPAPVRPLPAPPVPALTLVSTQSRRRSARVASATSRLARRAARRVLVASLGVVIALIGLLLLLGFGSAALQYIADQMTTTTTTTSTPSPPAAP